MLDSMESTTIAAWWGAIIASIVLMWDIYKWLKQGPQINLSLSPNMQVWGDPTRENITWVSVTVTNTGDRPTTIKGIGMEYYTSWLKRIRNRADKAAVFPNPNDNFPLPRVLNPGEEWVGLIPQKRIDKGMDMESMSNAGHLMIWLTRSDKPRSMKKRLVISKNEKNNS